MKEEGGSRQVSAGRGPRRGGRQQPPRPAARPASGLVCALYAAGRASALRAGTSQFLLWPGGMHQWTVAPVP